MKNLTTETRRHGEETEHRFIGPSGHATIPESVCAKTGNDVSTGLSIPVILSEAPPQSFRQVADSRGVEVELKCGRERSGSPQAKSRAEAREPSRSLLVNTVTGSFASLRISAERLKRRSKRLNFDSPSSRIAGLGLAQDDSGEARRSRKNDIKKVQRLQDTLGILVAVLREIFDEAPYDRFLLRTRAARSVSSYRDFLREREEGITRKPRCC